MEKIKAFAPVNIAWIKYMGKLNGLPTNSSLSMTLDRFGTDVEFDFEPGPGLKFDWKHSPYLPPEKGRLKMEAFLRNEMLWKREMDGVGFSASLPQGVVTVKTKNNVPAGTGIATSASSFAAFTMAWTALCAGGRRTEWIQKTKTPMGKRTLARIAQKGSGSSCRSFDGPWVEWNPSQGVNSAIDSKSKFVDFILLLEEGHKAVGSSEAHERVLTSPLFMGRVRRAEDRLIQVKSALREGSVSALQDLVLTEALDMHELFHTAKPSFGYLNSESLRWIELVKNHSETLPTQTGILTLDAGANIHLFVPEEDAPKWQVYFQQQKGLKFLMARSGSGAHYEV